MKHGAKVTFKYKDRYKDEIFSLIQEELQRQNSLNENTKRRLFSFALENNKNMREILEKYENEEFLCQLCYEEILTILSFTSNAKEYKAKLLDILFEEDMREAIFENFYIRYKQSNYNNWFLFLYNVMIKIGCTELINYMKDFTMTEEYGDSMHEDDEEESDEEDCYDEEDEMEDNGYYEEQDENEKEDDEEED